MNSLPDAVVTLIFEKLPPETLVVCDRVCTYWRRLIRDPAFVYRIMAYSCTPLQLLCVPSDEKEDEETYSLYTDDSSFVKQNTAFTDFPYTGFKVIGSCNGILCLANQQHREYMLCNPLLKMLKKLPAPLLSFDPSRCHVMAGFGFEGDENDFKILRFIVHNSFSTKPVAEMYSWSSDSWRRVKLPSLGCNGVYNYQNGRSVCFEGCLYQLGLYDEVSMVLKFQLKDGEVENIHLPEEIGKKRSQNLFLYSSKDGISLFCLNITRADAGAEVWSRKDEGWIKKYNLARNVDALLGFLGTGEIIVQDMGWLKLYDPKKKVMRLLNIEYHNGSSMISYAPSLAFLENDEVRDWIVFEMKRRSSKRRGVVIGRGVTLGRGMRTILWFRFMMKNGRMKMRHQL